MEAIFLRKNKAIMIITSINNNKIKVLKSLFDKKMREELGLFLAEGQNTLKELDSSYIKEVFVSESAYIKSREQIDIKIIDNPNISLFIVSDVVFSKISDTATPAGLITVCRIKETQNIGFGDIAVLDRIRDPGNLGTILRSAEAFGIKDLILVDCVELYNPKVVRSSLGSILGLNIIICSDSATALKLLDGIELYSLSMSGKSIYEFAPRSRVAIVVGNEASGVSEDFLKVSKGIISIPMLGQMESLNAAVSFSIAVSFLENNKENSFFDLLK